MFKMTKKVLSLICLISFIKLGSSVSVPNLTRCKAEDNKCLKSSIQAMIPIFAKGIPELGVQVLDPAYIKKPIDAPANGLKLVLDDLTVSGLQGCVIKKAMRDVAKSKIIGTLVCDVNVEGNYDIEGQLLILRVSGKGKIHVVLRKIAITLDADVSDIIGKDGKTYWDIKRFSHTYKLLDKADVVFDNLFTGNDVLGRAASEVIKSSGNEIIDEVGPPVIQVIVKKVMENIRKFFNNVPADELALD